MRFVFFFVACLLVLPASSDDDDGGTFSQLEHQLQEYRKKLALYPEEFFQLERTINMLELVPLNGSTVHIDIAKFREKFATKLFNLVEDLFELEADLRELYQDQEVEEEDEQEEPDCGSWKLAMNLNPTDGHIMSYITGWAGNSSIGSYGEALQKDYLDKVVWNQPAKYITVARHQNGAVEAVKVFKSIYNEGYSLFELFNSSNPDFYRKVVGLKIQENISTSATVTYDPIFSVGGDLAINWGFGNDGVRIVLTGGYLEAAGTGSGKTSGLGSHYACDPVAGTATDTTSFAMEIGSMSNSGSYPYAIGTDYGSTSHLSSYTSAYGQYAIYVSEDADTFPGPGSQLQLEVDELC